MKNLVQYAGEQYALVQASRKVLLDYCRTITLDDFLKENSSFGRGGSMRNLLVHIANTYEFWIARQALKKNVTFTAYDAINSVDGVISLFDAVDAFMSEFTGMLEKPEMQQIMYEINGVKNSAPPFKLFSHVITHEFHHKGQVLSLSRQLGYIPVDTDIMR